MCNYQYAHFNSTFICANVRYLWNIKNKHFDNSMDTFACDGSNDERLFRSCEEYDNLAEKQLIILNHGGYWEN